MAAKYGNKQEKSQEAKKRSAVEQRPVHELESDGHGVVLGDAEQMGPGQPSPPGATA